MRSIGTCWITGAVGRTIRVRTLFGFRVRVSARIFGAPGERQSG